MQISFPSIPIHIIPHLPFLYLAHIPPIFFPYLHPSLHLLPIHATVHIDSRHTFVNIVILISDAVSNFLKNNVQIPTSYEQSSLLKKYHPLEVKCAKFCCEGKLCVLRTQCFTFLENYSYTFRF